MYFIYMHSLFIILMCHECGIKPTIVGKGYSQPDMWEMSSFQRATLSHMLFFAMTFMWHQSSILA